MSKRGILKAMTINDMVKSIEESEREGESPMEKLSEQIQSDLITYLDGFSNEILDGVCKIIVDNFKGTYE